MYSFAKCFVCGNGKDFKFDSVAAAPDGLARDRVPGLGFPLPSNLGVFGVFAVENSGFENS